MRLLRFSLLLVLAVTAPFVQAQETGSITGTVRDNTGAVIPGAEVNVTSEAQGVVQKATTNSNGDFLVAGLPAGHYDLTIAANGFKKFAANGIVLRVAQKARVDAILQVGEISTEVTVAGEAVAQVETQFFSEISPASSPARRSSQIVLNGRNFTQASDPGAGCQQSDGPG